jgi:diguanylate cyclase (GGDEF)-like protein
MPRRAFFLAVILAILAVCILIIVSILSWGGADLQGVIHPIAEASAGLLAVTAALLAAVRSRGRRAAAWGFWSAYALLLTAGSSMLAWSTVTAQAPPPFPSPQDVVFLAAIPFGAAGALAMIRTSTSSKVGVAVALLDGLLVGAGLLVIGLATIFSSFFDKGANGTLVNVVSLAEPATDAVILTLISIALARTRVMRPAMALLCAGVTAITLSDSTVTFQTIGVTAPSGIPFDLGWTAGLLLVALGALHAICYRRDADSRRDAYAPRAMSVFLPITPVVLACGFAIADYVKERQTTDGILLGAMFSMITLTVVRMCIALYMNTRLGNSLAHQASHDALTGLANRELLRRYLSSGLAIDASAQRRATMMMLDVDGFKNINDSFGHHVGDLLLIQLAARLRACVRETDMVGRLGGDEFAVVLRESSEPVTSVARRVLAALEHPVSIGELQIVVTSSIGIASGGDDDSADVVLRNADLAMYAAKASGGSQYALYAPEMHAAATERVQLESDLRADWASEDLTVHYQPIVDLKTGRMVSVEALARWHHRTRGMVPPDVFIPVAEQTGLIVPIGAKILREACRQLASWQLHYPGARDLGVSVNISARQLHSDELTTTVTEALHDTGMEAGSLILEVTETALVEDMERAIQILSGLRSFGVRIAIDDFGIGASSLARLRRLPVDIVKIDKSLVDHIPDGHVASALLQSVIGVVSALQLRSVLEGVERIDQAAHLAGAGYDMAQGYFYSRPVTAGGVAALLEDGRDLDLGGAVQPFVAHPVDHGSEEPERILIMEDDAALGAVTSRILEHHGMLPVLVSTCGEGIQELQSRRVDGAIVDIRLPDGEGWSVIREIRREERLAQIPIVIMTGSLDSADMLNRARAERCEYLGKPFAPEALVAKLELARRLAPILVR